MQVTFTVPGGAVIPPANVQVVGNGVPYAAGTMIQSQPINLATTNGVSSRPSDAAEKVDGIRQNSVSSLTTRNVHQNHAEQQAQDLSIHSLAQHAQQQTKFEADSVNNNTLLDFCNIILNYTNYPDAFHEEFKPNGSKSKVKSPARSKLDVEGALQRPPQKRKLGNHSSINNKQKPGRKPKGAKFSPPTTAAPTVSAPRLRAESISGPSLDENGSRTEPSRRGDEIRLGSRTRVRKVSSPLNSVGESREGTHSSSSSTSSHTEERERQGSNLFYPDDDRDESWEEVTCFCGKPFAGRPMIECENCFVWHHMSCVKLRKTNVPKKFYCRDCKPMFPDFVQERSRRASGNNNTPSAPEPLNPFPKTPLKSSKNGLGSGTDVTKPLSLAIPPEGQPPLTSKDQSNSPVAKLHPLSSPEHSPLPQEAGKTSQLPSGETFSPALTTPPSAPAQLRTKPYVNGVAESKPVGSAESPSKASDGSDAGSSPSPSKKSGEKGAKRRPTLNSASSGLYDDVVLALKIN